MNSIKKLLAIILVIALSLSLAACGNSDTTKTEEVAAAVSTETTTDAVTEEADVEEEPEPVMDLGGMEITIGDWWSPEEPAAPTTAKEEATLAYREMIQEKYNFKIKQVAVGGWGEMQELYTTSVMAEDPAADIFILAPSWVAQPLANGLFYDLATLDNLDLSDSKWNNEVVSKLTYGDSIYGMAVGMPEPRIGMYWNKRLFEEAGLDADLPYDLQASGEWTWAKFEELCEKLTVDTNNDGVIDSYAMANFSVEFLRAAVTSNNATFIGKDASGKVYNATEEPNFLEAAQWFQSLIEKGYEMPQPEDSNWDWFMSAFHDSKVAMAFGEQYKCGNWADMTDDWGFVLIPKGPKATSYAGYFSDNIVVIPSSFDKETAEKIAFAYNLWANPTPGYEDEGDGWKDNYYTRYRDERAVDETLAMMYDGSMQAVPEYLEYVYGTSYGDFAYTLYGLGVTPAEKIEEVKGLWESLISDANN